MTAQRANRSVSGPAQEILKQRAEAFRFVDEKGMADVFHYVYPLR
jgi:hypothetical protein